MARVEITVRVSEAEAAEIDRARGAVERGPWLRRVALAAVREPKPAVAAARPAPEPAAGHSRSRANCKHQGLRLVKGVCPECFTYVEKKP